MAGAARSSVARTALLAEAVARTCGAVAAVLLLALVAITCVDVVGRYLFAHPLTGSVEIVTTCMAGIIIFTLPLIFLRGDHITVVLIPWPANKIRAAAAAIAVSLFGCAVAVLIGLRVWAYAGRAYQDGDVTEFLRIPQWPVVGLIAASIFAAALMAGLRCLRILGGPSSAIEDTAEDRRE